MRLAHTLAAAAAILAAILATPTAVHAESSITQQFAADSGDSCRYGFTDGTLTWRFGPTTSPLPLSGVALKGRVADRPLPIDPGTPCLNDGLFSVATFVAASGTREIDREARRADNGITTFEFALGDPATVSGIDRVVIQVCRFRLSSTTPAYCGRAVEYPVPPIA
jgi:hypothetical protein